MVSPDEGLTHYVVRPRTRRYQDRGRRSQRLLSARGRSAAFRQADTVSARVLVIERLVKSEPALLVVHGVMRSQRISPEEVRQPVRSSGQGGLEQVAAVVLGTAGRLSAIPASSLGSGDALSRVKGWEAER